jgi:hypothetical protein
MEHIVEKTLACVRHFSGFCLAPLKCLADQWGQVTTGPAVWAASGKIAPGIVR